MSKLSEAERDGAAAARQIHALKYTIGRLNVVSVVLPYSCFVLLNAYLTNVMLQFLIQKSTRKSGRVIRPEAFVSFVWEWGLCLQHASSVCRECSACLSFMWDSFLFPHLFAFPSPGETHEQLGC